MFASLTEKLQLQADMKLLQTYQAPHTKARCINIMGGDQCPYTMVRSAGRPDSTQVRRELLQFRITVRCIVKSSSLLEPNQHTYVSSSIQIGLTCEALERTQAVRDI
jgi:hypothetical protein